MKFILLLLFNAAWANFHQHQENGAESLKCYDKWLQGYRLASGRPQKVLRDVTLRICEDECSNTRGCAAFAYGVGGEANGTCELATRTRDSRAATNETLTLSDVENSHHYDVYIEKAGDHCFKTSALYGNPNSHTANGVPIDCFYRLMAGKRLSKIHVLKSVSVPSIQECQEACILERGFQCRSISYRYMPTGYTYSVSNCELSEYTESPHSVHDYIEDYDYDYFQREPHCKTTSSANSYGVCAVVVRRGGLLGKGLVKSSHSVTTMGKCEHLCATALFRCRAFSFRHTERGRENYFQRETESCLLHDADIGRLPNHNIEANPDFDLYEMGRLMGAECILYDQYNRNRNGGIGHNYAPSTDRAPPPMHTLQPLDNRPLFDRRPPPYVGSSERHYPASDRNFMPPYDANRNYNYDRSRFNTNNYPPSDYNSRPPYSNNPRDGQSFHNSSLQHETIHPPLPSTLHQSGPTQLPPPLPPPGVHRRPPDGNDNNFNIKAFHNNRPVYMDTLDYHTHNPSGPPPPGPEYIRPSSGQNPNPQNSEFPNRPSSEFPGPGNFHSYDVNPLRGNPPPPRYPQPPQERDRNNHYPVDERPATRHPDDGRNPGYPPPRGPPGYNHGPPPHPPPGNMRPESRYPDERDMRPRYPNPGFNVNRDKPHGGSGEFGSEYPEKDVGYPPKERYPERYQGTQERYQESVRYPTALQISHQSSPITIPMQSTSPDQSESPTIQGIPFGPPEGIVQGTSSLMPTTSTSISSSSSSTDKTNPPYYNREREVCLVRLKADSYLAPELSRATFPVKTIEECRVECIRSYDVLRFQCKVMSFRLTSTSGGSCQLSDQDHRQFRESDYVPARDRYEGATTFFYDDRDPICRQQSYSTPYDRYGSGYFGGGGRYTAGGVNNYYDRDRYTSGVNNYNDRYQDSTRGRYGESRYSGTPDNRYDDNYNRYGYFNQAGSYQGQRTNYASPAPSSFTSGFTTSGGSGAYGRYGSGGNYGTYGNYPEYPSGTGQTTVNGERCLRSCRQNREAGFFYCQVDDQGSWDFCCRPDHFCGFSPGLSVSWCYVGTGPSQSIWRSCNHRYNEQNKNHNVAYLHEGPPPTIHKLSNTEVANLTKDNALALFKASAPVFPETASSNSEEQVVKTLMPPVILQSLQLEKKDDKLIVIQKKEEKKPSVVVLNGLNMTSSEDSHNSTRTNRRTPRTPTFYDTVDERL